jgi:hypothetical protein
MKLGSKHSCSLAALGLWVLRMYCMCFRKSASELEKSFQGCKRAHSRKMTCLYFHFIFEILSSLFLNTDSHLAVPQIYHQGGNVTQVVLSSQSLKIPAASSPSARSPNMNY